MPKIYCPITEPIATDREVLAQLAPLIEHLNGNFEIETQTIFPKGTIMPDGRLDLCKQNLGVAGCDLITTALATNRTIVSLLLGTNGIGDIGATAVAESIRQNDRLKIVYLGCNAITAAGIASLSAALAQSKTITGLWLKRNPIGAEGAKHIATMLATNQSIRTLDLVHTQIGFEGVKSIVEVLMASNKSIDRLYLGGNDLDVDGAKLLARLLRTTDRIKALLLNVNRLGDDGAEILATALSQNTTLQELGLASNGIGHRGCIALMSTIHQHLSLVTLDLGYSPSTRVLGATANQISDLGVESIAKMLELNHTLQKLDLRRTEISPEGQQILLRALTINTSIRELLLTKPLDLITKLLDARISIAAPQPNCDVALIRSVYRN
jgi:Ran GTPase-activating protein (RanGAP) involved in mRNA processing and transport